jgi:hypothetical protein
MVWRQDDFHESITVRTSGEDDVGMFGRVYKDAIFTTLTAVDKDEMVAFWHEYLFYEADHIRGWRVK